MAASCSTSDLFSAASFAAAAAPAILLVGLEGAVCGSPGAASREQFDVSGSSLRLYGTPWAATQGPVVMPPSRGKACRHWV